MRLPFASQGGVARAKKLTAEERREIAREAAVARWDKASDKGPLARETHSGTLHIGDIDIPCSVLDTGERVFSVVALHRAMGSRQKAGARSAVDGTFKLPPFLSSAAIKPFLSNDLVVPLLSPIPFRPKQRGRAAFGYKAELLPQICEVILDADQAGAMRADSAVVQRAHILIRGFARVGIIALVDEATGYQEVRDRLALQAILDKFLAKELAAWAKRFPDEFYQQMFRLKGWQDLSGVQRPGIVGKYTNDLVYERLAPALLEKLQQLNPKDERGHRKARHHQWLTEDIGHPALAQHLHAVVGFMRAADSWEQFIRLMNRAYPKRNTTLLLPGME